jgi:DNA modification methylase
MSPLQGVSGFVTKTAYNSIVPIESAISADRQSAKRHYGVHPYFTRRPYNVVREYILHYSKQHDRVLDPFGGSGVTAIEAFLDNRVGIQNDINPLANFIAKGIVDLGKGDIAEYERALVELKEICQSKLIELYQLSEDGVKAFSKKLEMPENIELPRNSDVRTYRELFSNRQIASLALLRGAIDKIHDKYAKKAMLLAWSASLAKLNRTFLSAEGRAESRGGSSIFSIYRYKIAKEPVELPPWKTFEERAQNVIAAKAEIDKSIDFKRRTSGWSGQFEVHARDIDELSEELDGKVDYIFTDPPYGGNISYLDLSTLWNCWLNMMPSRKTRQVELIVGGDLEISEGTYTERLGKSIKACTRMLKKDRWLSVVFQHWNTAYFDAILSSAAEAGADLRAAVPQVGDIIWSMHKKKGNESVLAGELILTFYKTGEPKKIEKQARDFDIEAVMAQILSGANTKVIYGEHIFNQLILAAWHKQAIASLQITKNDFIDIIKGHGWEYDEENHHWVKHQLESILFGYARG